jgi:S-formylglutathione hydrolase FrmB
MHYSASFMNISLLSQNFVVYCSLIAAVSWTLIISRLKKRWFGWHGLDMLALAVLSSFVIGALIQQQYPTDQLPSLFWLMILPFTFSIFLIFVTWKSEHSWLKWLAIGTTVFSFVYSLILINGYYNFYPTVGSVFNVGVVANNSPKVLNSSALDTSKSGTIEQAFYAQPTSLVGQVKSINIPGTVSKFNARGAYVYVASRAASLKLPVIVLTAGTPGLPSNWLGSGLATTMDQFAESHHGITPYVFMVDNTGSVTNDTECVNSPRGNVETYLTEDVPNYIKAHYTVSDSSSQWAIGGLSMGGMCSFMLALRHPNIYDNFLDFGGETGPEVGSVQATTAALFNGSEKEWAAHQPLLLLKSNKYPDMNGFFGDGDQDSPNLISGLQQSYQASKKAGISSVFEEVNGGHIFPVWQQLFKDSLPWISNRLGATDCTKVCQQ